MITATYPIVDTAITSRRSIRAYLPTPVSDAQISDIVRVAQRAPSGTNTQPWQVYALSGAALKAGVGTLLGSVMVIFLQTIFALAMAGYYFYHLIRG